MNIKPLGLRITIEPVNEEPREEIYVPDETRKKVSKGKVLAVGDEVTKVKVGDVVVFSPFQYDEITEEVFIVEERDIWAIYE